MNYELVVKGNIVLENEIVKGSVGIMDGKIVTISGNTELNGEVVRDFGEKFIFPGAIDVHVHCFSNPEEGFKKTSHLSARGGVTTFLDMPYDLPTPVSKPETFKNKVKNLEEEAIVDIGLWGTMAKRGGTPDLKPLIEAGAMSFKMSTFETDEYRFPRIPNDEIVKAMKELADTGILVAFHSEDDEIVKSMTKAYQEHDSHYNLSHTETRPPYTETTAVLKLLELAYWTGAKLHIVHVSHPRTLDLIRTFKEMGTDVSAETCYPYLLLDTEDLDKYGPVAKMNPPLRKKEEAEKMWEHLKEGNIDLISSDHVMWDETEKKKGYENIFNAPSGLPGLEVIVPLIFDGMVNRRDFSPNAFAKLMSTNPAERFGIANKGKIGVNYDADFVVIDPKAEWQLNANMLDTNPNLLPFKERIFKGKVTETIVRGRTVFDGKKVTTEPGYGKFIQGSGAASEEL